jgi:hypothetical protein
MNRNRTPEARLLPNPRYTVTNKNPDLGEHPEIRILVELRGFEPLTPSMRTVVWRLDRLGSCRAVTA